MAASQVWVVRAPDEIASEVEKNSMVAIGWSQMGGLDGVQSREAMKRKFREIYPELSDKRIAIGAGQLYRFVHEIHKGDFILTPLRETRQVLVGHCTAEYAYDVAAVSKTHPNVRKVDWVKKASRDQLSTPLKNALGGLMTVFTINEHLNEVEGLLGQGPIPQPDEESAPPFYEDVRDKATELTTDLLYEIDAFDFQDLVAGLLRAVGYRTRVSPPSPDGGVDIRAFPDPFGFHTPRIRVQVKHRKGHVTLQEIQQFIGVIGSDYSGLYVSTGGFTGQARQEADKRSNLSLMDQGRFIEALLENYERLDPQLQALIPLRKVYIPIRPR